MAEESRTCLYFNVCGRTETYTGRWKEHWHPYQEGYLCKTHYSKLVGYKKRSQEKRKEYNDKWNKKRVQFKGIQLIQKVKPRTGYCSKCSNNIHDGSCKKTNIHHIQYHENDHLKDTIELCASCHAYETVEKRINENKKMKWVL